MWIGLLVVAFLVNGDLKLVAFENTGRFRTAQECEDGVKRSMDRFDQAQPQDAVYYLRGYCKPAKPLDTT